MAIETVAFEIAPEDGWVLVATDPSYLFLKPDSAVSYRLCVTASGAPSVDDIAAEGAVNFAGQPNNGGTVTVGDITYTFVTAFDDPGPYEVKIGANQAASEAALTAAINGRAAIPATGSVGSVIFTGLPVAGQTVTIGTEVYTFRAARAVAFEVTIGADATATGANLVTALGLDSAIVSGINTTGTVALTSDATGFATNYALAETATNTAVSGAAMTGGNDEGPAITLNLRAHATDGAGVVDLEALAAGPAGNDVPLSENANNITVTAFSGGSEAPAGVLFGGNRKAAAEDQALVPFGSTVSGEFYVSVEQTGAVFNVIRDE